MLLTIFLEFATAFLVSFLSSNFATFGLVAVDDFRRLIACQHPPPPPPPQIFFPTSADWADDFHLSSLANLTKTTPPSPVLDYTDSSEALLPRHYITVAAEVIVAFLYALVAVGPPAATAWALLGLRSRDLQQSRKATVLSLALFWEQFAVVNDKERLIARLSRQLENAAIELASQGVRLTRAGFIKDQLVEALSAIQLGLEREQRASNDQIKQATEERDALRTEHEALLRTVEELRARETARNATKRLQEATAKRQENAANSRIQVLEAERTSAFEKTEKLETDLKEARELISSLQSTIQSNSQELHAHRSRMRAGYSAPFSPAPQQQFPPQFQQQGQFGFPPNRTNGFMGNTPPPGWGRGAGAGAGPM